MDLIRSRWRIILATGVVVVDGVLLGSCRAGQDPAPTLITVAPSGTSSGAVPSLAQWCQVQTAHTFASLTETLRAAGAGKDKNLNHAGVTVGDAIDVLAPAVHRLQGIGTPSELPVTVDRAARQITGAMAIFLDVLHHYPRHILVASLAHDHGFATRVRPVVTTMNSRAPATLATYLAELC